MMETEGCRWKAKISMAELRSRLTTVVLALRRAMRIRVLNFAGALSLHSHLPI